MKKIAAMFMAIMLISNLVIPARAASEEYVVSEMGLSLAIPDTYIVFTRDIDKNDPALADFGISKEELMNQLTAGHIYLNAVLPDGNEEIVVTMEENIISEFNGLGETSLLMLASTLKEGYEEYGMSVSSYDVYHHPQLEFIRIYFNTADKTTYGLQYYTIYGGQAMNFTMRSYDGPISRTQEKTIQNVVDSVDLHFYVPTKTPIKETPAFLHTDPDTGTTFTVPANWSVQPFSKERNYLDIQFGCAADPALLISYSSYDIWSELSFIEKLFVSRKNATDLMASISEVAEEYGVPESSVSTKRYNGVEYYIIEIPYTTEMYGTSISVLATQAVRIENGWAYAFNFGANKNNPHFSEFEQLLSSVEFGDKGTSGSGGGWVLVIAVVAVILGLTIFRKKKAQQKETAVSATTAIVETKTQQEYFFCHKCGNKLPADSMFCNVCGARLIEKEDNQ